MVYNYDNLESLREFRDDEFWKMIPAWENVSKEEFNDIKWQNSNCVQKLSQVKKVLGHKITDDFYSDIEKGLQIAPMNIRMTPYVFALINWDNPKDDPLRKQFLPIGSDHIKDHPFCMLDSLYEDVDSPVALLTHRYPDKVLFLPLTICPVYCAYCTRSRVIGGSTDAIEKETYGTNPKNWEPVFEYIRRNPQIEDVVISGGDAYNLMPKHITLIGETLLNIPHIRRMRFATKGIAILPQKVLRDDNWFNALNDVHKKGLNLGKQVVIHTHFSSPNEITMQSKLAMDRLFSEGIIVRNQAVLQEGVNAHDVTMIELTKKLSFMNIQPYYVYQHDMIQGCENLRTSLAEAIEIEKKVRGMTAGFNTPTFVCDLPEGGGKRHVASYEYYDQENGISIWKAPNVKPNQIFTYFDPIHKLSLEAQNRWKNPQEQRRMVKEAQAKVLGNQSVAKVKNI
jgi:lysine 2,3-aminomutase